MAHAGRWEVLSPQLQLNCFQISLDMNPPYLDLSIGDLVEVEISSSLLSSGRIARLSNLSADVACLMERWAIFNTWFIMQFLFITDHTILSLLQFAIDIPLGQNKMILFEHACTNPNSWLHGANLYFDGYAYTALVLQFIMIWHSFWIPKRMDLYVWKIFIGNMSWITFLPRHLPEVCKNHCCT